MENLPIPSGLVTLVAFFVMLGLLVLVTGVASPQTILRVTAAMTGWLALIVCGSIILERRARKQTHGQIVIEPRHREKLSKAGLSD